MMNVGHNLVRRQKRVSDSEGKEGVELFWKLAEN